MRTTIYLDVDGVLNAVSRRNPTVTSSGWPEYGWESAPINGYPIRWAKSLIAALNELAARPDVTFKWLTTWTHDAAKVLSPAIGIDGQDWEVLEGDQHAWGGKRGWWKLEAIQSDVLSTKPDQFIWIDDDLSMERDAIEWVAGRDNGYAISPFGSEALTRFHIEEIKALTMITPDAA